jgi:hypothetical protein
MRLLTLLRALLTISRGFTSVENRRHLRGIRINSEFIEVLFRGERTTPRAETRVVVEASEKAKKGEEADRAPCEAKLRAQNTLPRWLLGCRFLGCRLFSCGLFSRGFFGCRFLGCRLFSCGLFSRGFFGCRFLGCRLFSCGLFSSSFFGCRFLGYRLFSCWFCGCFFRCGFFRFGCCHFNSP